MAKTEKPPRGILKEPIALSPLLADLIPKCYGAPYFKISEDSKYLVEWWSSQSLPTEKFCQELMAQSAANAVRARREPLLKLSDEVALRCHKAGKDFPADWRKFTQALRDWPKNPDANAPKTPAIPDGI